MALLEINDLHVTFPTDDGLVRAVRGVSFSVDKGKTLGIVGESGSGKSVSTQTIMGLTRGAQISGQALFEGKDLLKMSPEQLRDVRGRQIAMIFQDPLSSLHPYYRVGWQIVEMIRAHEAVSKQAARQRAVDLLRLVGIPRPEVRVDDFPHQFSGGMRQRAMIAMAMALNPALLIADEPTTALDVTVQAQVLRVIERLQEEFGTAVIIITHDLGVIAETADDVVVMYAGLLRSLPAYGDERTRLLPISGQPPSLITLPPGCKFNPRCPYVMDRCLNEEPPLAAVEGRSEHLSSCWLPHSRTGRLEARERVLGEPAST
jgi:peptide/nickel transport system ATP-binding protein